MGRSESNKRGGRKLKAADLVQDAEQVVDAPEKRSKRSGRSSKSSKKSAKVAIYIYFGIKEVLESVKGFCDT